MIPLLIDLGGRRVVVFGGGDVSLRKAAFFCREADVVVVSRSFVPDLRSLAVEMRELDLAAASDAMLEEILAGAFLAVAATDDPAVNNRIGRICRQLGIHFNNAEGESGDVIVPSVVKGENFAIAITTFGRSPAIARYLRMALEETYPMLDDMIRLQEDLRRELRRVEPSRTRRSEVLWEVLRDREVWEAISRGHDAAWRVVRGRYLHD
ncbi:MAG: bifunctional precorrin-2 dehydrogenase/sirohydrochlorin ferrochelatase [Methanomicrobiales archaeon]|nr:bifunctional precorrin-2 dehydrogenase/sirohydrochlorin ferrochelatase [Methanomicrobiales archaeon]MDI6876418.1 bifunctional precorrin-2 dehydrogenase/sirohydrochlorin ferrochelatase [Methanomicrobiales archaeon]